MQQNMLLPNQFKKMGWVMLGIAVILWLYLLLSDHDASFNAPVFAFITDEIMGKTEYFKIIQVDILPSLVGTLFIVGGLLVSFSKEPQEDEYIASVRLASMQWAVLVSYGLLLFAFMFIFGLAFLTVMQYNMFTVLILFIARFHFVLFLNSKK
jgi:hypothetical protein